MGIASGRLRDRVSLEDETRSPNGQGGFTTAWSAIDESISAEVIGLTGEESVTAAVERTSQRWRVTMRKRTPPVTTKQRLFWDGRALNIKSVLPDPKAPRSAIICICESIG